MSLNLFLAAEKCLLCAEVEPKLTLARRLRDDLNAGRLSRTGKVVEPDLLEAGRPPRPALVARPKSVSLTSSRRSMSDTYKRI